MTDGTNNPVFTQTVQYFFEPLIEVFDAPQRSVSSLSIILL